MKPTITYLIYNTKQNGGNTVIFEHVNRLYQRGYNVRIVTVFGKSPDWFTLNVPLQYLAKTIVSKTDILVATFWPTAFIALFLRARKKFYFVLGWEPDMNAHVLLKLAAFLTYTFPFAKIVISSFLKKQLINFGYDKQPIYQIKTCGINTTLFHPLLKPRQSTKTVRILSVVSSYFYYKGPDLLATVVKELKSRHPDYRFVLVSSKETKPYSPVFDEFYAHISNKELAKLYQESDVFLTTSRTEGFYIPGLEAMASGCPVITTNSGGITEYANNKNAIIVEDIQQIWKDDLIEKLINDKPFRQQVIQNGLATAYKYNWKTIIDDLEKIYL